MPKQARTFMVCDICNGGSASKHKITHNNQTVEIDLCPAHAEPFEELFERFVRASPRSPGFSTSPHRCKLCPRVLSRRVHAAEHVQRMHGYLPEESYAHIQPVGARQTQVLGSPSHQPHRCKICKKPYVNSSTAKRHVAKVHPDRIKRGKRAADYIKLIVEED